MDAHSRNAELSQALQRLADSLRDARDALCRLEAALERFNPPAPMRYDPDCLRMLTRLTRRCDMPVARYLRRF